MVDERRALTFRSLHERSNAQANALRVSGITDGSKVGVLCRNHAGFVEATAALAKIGADAVLCNTGFGATQLADVLEREHVLAIVHDEEFGTVVRSVAPSLPAYLRAGTGARPTVRPSTTSRTGDPSDSPLSSGRRPHDDPDVRHDGNARGAPRTRRHAR